MTTTTEPLTELEIRRSSPSALKKSVSRGRAGDFQKAMLDRHRGARKRLEKVVPSGESSILWSAGGAELSEADQQLKRLLTGTKKQHRAGRRLAVQAVIEGDARPLVVLTAVDTLVRCGADLRARDYAALYCALSRVTEIAPNQPIKDDDELSIQRLVCEGELPLLLSLVLHDLKGQAGRIKSAVRVLRDGLNAGTDTDGMLHAGLTSAADAWLAPLVRAAHWSHAFRESWMNAADTERLADAVRSSSLLLVKTGLLTSPPAELRDATSPAAELIEYGLSAVGVRESSPFMKLARTMNPQAKRRSRKGKRSSDLEVSNQSDWGASALLRTGLQADADVCVVNWDQPQAAIHLGILGIPLLSGSWFSEVSVNGESIGEIKEWHCSCWFCDDEAAFVELEADPSESIHVVRHVMLSMQDRQGVVCETVTTDHAEAEVKLTSRLPLAADPLAVTNSITREIVLHADKVSARVIPAWLDDDRVNHATGRCEKEQEHLLSEAHGPGGAAVPLVFDWDPKRQAMDADWNRLTVTEARKVVRDQLAVGFRARIGSKQMLIYRSLRRPDLPRAVMGLHSTNETVFGLVKKSGEVAPLVLVEGD